MILCTKNASSEHFGGVCGFDNVATSGLSPRKTGGDKIAEEKIGKGKK